MKSVLLFALFLSGACCQSATAQESLNMVGTWKGQATAVQLGSNPYRAAGGAGANFPEAGLEFTFVVTEQHGNRFAGTASAGTRSETIIGALAPDGATGVMLDDDGQYMLTIKDQNTVDVCYFHVIATGKVVSCYPLKRAQ